jgi:hypothetical protein
MDRDKLKEALERVRPRWVHGPDGLQTDVPALVIAAARAVVEAPEAWWCEEHNAPSVWHDGSEPSLGREPWCFAYDMTGHQIPDQQPCRMVVVYLVPKEEV